MIIPIPFNSLYTANHGWLQSRFHFSFAEYYDRENMHFGVLRVMNDDIIAPHTGFGTHPHHDMEIITYVLSGELMHQDSMGNAESLGRGSIQYMSAGTSVSHSEKNEADVPLHLIQTWILPSRNDLIPHYGSKVFDVKARHNQWLHLIAPEGTPNVISIYQDANMFVTDLDQNSTLGFALKVDRQLYLKVMEGRGVINNSVFEQGDAAKVWGEDLFIEALSPMHILLVEMPKA